MITFIIALAILIIGYFTYGKLTEKIFGVSDSPTPANKINDGVDYVPMPTWKVFLIQLLNIAGTGPIFGALSGALFGPVVYIWIVLGSIFAGGVHDFMTAMVSLRHDGTSISEVVGIYLGKFMKIFMRIFSVFLLIMCGVVFTTGPSGLLAMITPPALNQEFWLYVVLIYYFVATFLPIDKIIGKIYPVFGAFLIFMALGVSASLLFSGKFQMPELWNNFKNLHPQGLSIWPFMFITVACGAISGFHSTQSPIMARCIKSEKKGRQVFYGAMISEGIIALIWAAAGVSCYDSTQALLAAGGGCSEVVYQICTSTLGKIGAIVAIIGVIACPISSGDTAFRSARLTLADMFNLDQKSVRTRLLITIPLLCIGAVIAHVDYNIVWRYFSWANQTLAMIALWAVSVYLLKNQRPFFISLIPAAFMTAVTTTYFVVAPECLGGLAKICKISNDVVYLIGVIAGILLAATFTIMFVIYIKRDRKLKLMEATL